MLSPAIGFGLALLLDLVTPWTARSSLRAIVDCAFHRLQLVSAALYSLGNGSSDEQKTKGIIAILLYLQSVLGKNLYVPPWVVLACQGAMAIGKLLGGWRIVQTLGSKITYLTLMQDFCAEMGGAMTLFGATLLGIPVPATHTMSEAIGVGAARRTSSVRWGVARSIVIGLAGR